MAEVADSAITIVPGALPSASPTQVAADALAAAKAYARQALAPETLRAYATDWGAFTTWCCTAGCSPLPAEPVTVAAYEVSC